MAFLCEYHPAVNAFDRPIIYLEWFLWPCVGSAKKQRIQIVFTTTAGSHSIVSVLVNRRGYVEIFVIIVIHVVIVVVNFLCKHLLTTISLEI